MTNESFATVVNCMDGRVQLPVIAYLKRRFRVSYVDVVSEPGPVRLLAERDDRKTLAGILQRVEISVERHKSQGLAVVAHYDCAGNPTAEAQQLTQLQSAVEYLAEKYPDQEVLGLWVNFAWAVSEVCAKRPQSQFVDRFR